MVKEKMILHSIILSDYHLEDHRCQLNRSKWLHHCNWSWWLNTVITWCCSLSLFLCSFAWFPVRRFPSSSLHINVHRNSVCHCYFKKRKKLSTFLAYCIAFSRGFVWVRVCLSVNILGILWLWKCDNSILNVVLCFSSDHFRANDYDDQSHCAHKTKKWVCETINGNGKKRKDEERSGWLVKEIPV